MEKEREELVQSQEDLERSKRAKISEGVCVLQMQSEVVDKLRKMGTRKFKRKMTKTRTIGGRDLWVWAWETEQVPVNKSGKEKGIEREKCVCDVCGRTFLDKRRLAIHKNVHLKGGDESKEREDVEERESQSREEVVSRVSEERVSNK
jgi:hypothetical protein